MLRFLLEQLAWYKFKIFLVFNLLIILIKSFVTNCIWPPVIIILEGINLDPLVGCSFWKTRRKVSIGLAVFGKIRFFLVGERF